MPQRYFITIEDNFGIAFACGPAIRQFLAYRRRTGSVLPTSRRQPRNADFIRTRRRVYARDIAQSLAEQGEDPRRAEARADQDARQNPEAARSVVDSWHGRLKGLLSWTTVSRSRGSTSNRARIPSAESGPTLGKEVGTTNVSDPVSNSGKRSMLEKYRRWGILPGSKSDGSVNPHGPFLLDDSAPSNEAQTGGSEASRWGSTDVEKEETLRDSSPETSVASPSTRKGSIPLEQEAPLPGLTLSEDQARHSRRDVGGSDVSPSVYSSQDRGGISDVSRSEGASEVGGVSSFSRSS